MAFSTAPINLTASTEAPAWRDEDMMDIYYIAYCIVGPTIIAIGCLGNTLTLVTLSRAKLWCNGMTYIYLKCLAATDACALLSAIAMDVRLGIPDRKLPYWEAFYQAHVEIPLLNFFMGASIFIVVCLTKDRFLSVCFPTKYRETSNNSKAQVSTALCYLFSGLLNAPLAVLKEVSQVEKSVADISNVHYEARENTDITETAVWKVYLYISEGIIRILPILLLALLNIAIIRKFKILAEKRKQLHGRRTQKKGSGTFSVTEERRMLVLLSTIVVLFVVLNLPSAVLSIIYTDSLSHSRPFQIFRACANDLELANFAINFYAYFMCSTEFRHAFFGVICGKKATQCLKNDSRPDGPSVKYDAASHSCDIDQNPGATAPLAASEIAGEKRTSITVSRLSTCKVDIHNEIAGGLD